MNPAKKQELISMIHQARSNFTRLPGPSDDTDEQSAWANAYRHVLVTIQVLATPILDQPARQQLQELSIDTGTMNDVYVVLPRLNALLFDIEEALDSIDALAAGDRLTSTEISRLVNNWIGVEGGYLGYPEQFTYATHDEFWRDTCSIVADTHGFDGTTRECFRHTLGRATADQQADVLEEILARYPVNDPADPDRPTLRMPTFEVVIRGWVDRLRPATTRIVATLDSASEEVRSALADAERLGAPRAVDRVHTAMHGYLHQISVDAGIANDGDSATMARLLKLIREEHPAFSEPEGSASHVTRVLQGMGTILDALNPLRNHASAAHPLNALLAEPEAQLVCDTVQTLLGYLHARVGNWEPMRERQD